MQIHAHGIPNVVPFFFLTKFEILYFSLQVTVISNLIQDCNNQIWVASFFKYFDMTVNSEVIHLSVSMMVCM